MTTQYTPILKLALPVQGELSGTWGDVVNDNITSMVEQAIAGRSVIDTWSVNSHVLTTANGTTAESRAAMLSLTDSGTALTGAGSVICPALSKVYIVKNGTAQVITVKTAAGSGIAVPVGKTMLVYCDGTDVLEAVDHVVTLSAGTLTITGLTTFASLKGTGAVTVTDILDEDNMASDSATALVTQQSVKAYVASQVGANNELSEVLANGNTTGANDIDVDAAQKVQFRDAAIYINSSVDGQLDIVADTEIQIDTTTVDINGAVDVSGTLDVTGAATFSALVTVNAGENSSHIKVGNSRFMTISTGTDGTYADAITKLAIDSSVGQFSFFNANTNELLNISSTALTLPTGIDLITATLGTSNFRAGVNAGNSIIAGGNYNVLVGDEAGTAITTGDANIAIGFEALKTEDANSFNVAIGYQALKVNNGGDANVAIGYTALAANTTANNNVAIGNGSMVANTTGTFNVGVGQGSLAANTTASNNTAVGKGALAANTTGDRNVAVGTTAGDAITTGIRNVLMGYTAGGSLITGSNNAAFGEQALSSDTNGHHSTAFGHAALANQNFTSTTDSNNTAVGYNAGLLVTTGVQNTLIGALAGDAITTGNSNVSVGYNSLSTNTAAHRNTAVGENALAAFNVTTSTNTYNTAVGYSAGVDITTGVNNTLIGGLAGDAITTGNNNSAVGYSALGANTTGGSNAAFGILALERNTTASNNSAFGQSSLRFNTTGANNVAIGFEALSANTTASNNTAVGTSALAANTTGAQVTSLGYQSGYSSTTGIGNTFIGMQAGYSNTSGSYNTFVGPGGVNGAAGGGITTGSNNTIIGAYSGNQYGLDIRTSSNNIVLSDGAGFPRASWNGDQTWSFSCGATDYVSDRVSIDRTAMYPYPDGAIQLGYPSFRWGQIYSTVGSISTSDARDKTSVTALTADEIQASKLLAREIGTYQWLASIEEKGADNARHHVGMTVQRAIEIMESCNLDPMRYGFICYDAWEKDDLPQLEAGDRYGFRYDELNQFIAAGFNARLEALES